MTIDNQDISLFAELKAETVASVISPDVKHWNVLHKGYFYRNYHTDLINLDTTNHSIETSRNGLMKILPEGLFFNPQQFNLKNKDNFKETKEKLDKLQKFYAELFTPFDSELFDISLKIENCINDNYDKIISNLLITCLGIDIDNITNGYAKALAPLTLAASKIRGDFRLITKLLSEIIDTKVTHEISRQTIKFIIHKANLNSVEYQTFNNELRQTFILVEDWFIPIQYSVEYIIKDYRQRFVLSSEKPLLLNYNTNL